MELRKASDTGNSAACIGIHAAGEEGHGAQVDAQAFGIAGKLCSAATPREILVSQNFFECARRTSPCTFSNAGTLDIAPGVPSIPVLRVSGSIARHPFQANYVHEIPDAPRRENSVAVKPIRMIGSGGDQDYLAEGLTEDLVLELGRIPGLFVSSRTTAPAIGMREATDIGSALGVRFVITGTLRRVGDYLTLNAIDLRIPKTGA